MHIKKTYNLITGLSDHNLTLVTRQLSKKRFRNKNPLEGKNHISLIQNKCSTLKMNLDKKNCVDVKDKIVNRTAKTYWILLIILY